MPDLDEKYNEFSRELGQSVSPEAEPTEENVCDERSYDERLKDVFQGKIVCKDLTKKIKEGANVPVYVLEFLLGQYCSSDDTEIIESDVETVKHILSDNFVRPDEAQKILSRLRSRSSHTVIDMITVHLDMRKNTYLAEFSNLGIKDIPIADGYPEKYDHLLCGGIWCIVQLSYEFIEEEKNAAPIRIDKLTPIQMPHIDLPELQQGRKAFTKEEWMELMLRSAGYEQESGTFIPPSAKTVNDLLDEYMSIYGVNTWAMSTYESRKSLIANYIRPLIGDMKLEDVTPRIMDKYYRDLLSVKAVSSKYVKARTEYLTPHTIREVHKTLRNALNQAVKWELMTRNPVTMIFFIWLSTLPSPVPCEWVSFWGLPGTVLTFPPPVLNLVRQASLLKRSCRE